MSYFLEKNLMIYVFFTCSPLDDTSRTSILDSMNTPFESTLLDLSTIKNISLFQDF